MGSEVVLIGAVASLIAGLATGAGTLPVLFTRRISDRLLDVMLGFAAGVMLAATSFSLLIPSLELGGPWIAVVGLLLGAVILHLIDRFIPHFSPAFGPEGPSSSLSGVWLFILAITIHNFPEGLAVGVSFGSGDVATGLIIATAIGLQNMPEGLAVALPLIREGYSRRKAIGYGTLTRLVEPLGGLLGAAIVTVSRPLLPWGLAFAAGTMLFVIADEMIPESHKKGYEREATFGLIAGFTIMMLLDVIFG
ncbi:MAG: ZIP family metal transporter [Candidatus Bathyarchaeota archaeon]|jgi:ZIP family zinc transporter